MRNFQHRNRDLIGGCPTIMAENVKKEACSNNGRRVKSVNESYWPFFTQRLHGINKRNICL